MRMINDTQDINYHQKERVGGTNQVQIPKDL